jgi:putative nucleotidyltransferase with HDIG domain
MEAIFTQLERSGISTIPTVLTRLLEISRDQEAEALDLARVCEKDIAIGSQLLRVANSVYFGRTMDQPRVDNLTDAVVRIGFRRAQEIIMSAYVSNVFKSRPAVVDYSLTALWKHSIAVATANRLLFKKVYGRLESLDPYLCGLFHDIGILLEHQFLLEKGFARAVEQRYARRATLEHVEHEIFGFSHAELGAELARRWAFPECFAELISCHHRTDLPADHPWLPMIQINQVSEWLCFALNMGYCDFSKEHAGALGRARQGLDISDIDIQQIAGWLRTEIEAYNRIGWFRNHTHRAA